MPKVGDKILINANTYNSNNSFEAFLRDEGLGGTDGEWSSFEMPDYLDTDDTAGALTKMKQFVDEATSILRAEDKMRIKKLVVTSERYINTYTSFFDCAYTIDDIDINEDKGIVALTVTITNYEVEDPTRRSYVNIIPYKWLLDQDDKVIALFLTGVGYGVYQEFLDFYHSYETPPVPVESSSVDAEMIAKAVVSLQNKTSDLMHIMPYLGKIKVLRWDDYPVTRKRAANTIREYDCFLKACYFDGVFEANHNDSDNNVRISVHDDISQTKASRKVVTMGAIYGRLSWVDVNKYKNNPNDKYLFCNS